MEKPTDESFFAGHGDKPVYCAYGLQGQLSTLETSVFAGNSTLDNPMIVIPNSTHSHGCSWKNVYLNMEDAIDAISRRNCMLKLFRRIPYIKDETLFTFFGALFACEYTIKQALEARENFNGIDFCDVGAYGIQIRMFHKQVTGYCFDKQYTINYDMSNICSVTGEAIHGFIERDTPEFIERYNRMLKEGERYGWD